MELDIDIKSPRLCQLVGNAGPRRRTVGPVLGGSQARTTKPASARALYHKGGSLSAAIPRAALLGIGAALFPAGAGRVVVPQHPGCSADAGDRRTRAQPHPGRGAAMGTPAQLAPAPPSCCPGPASSARATRAISPGASGLARG